MDLDTDLFYSMVTEKGKGHPFSKVSDEKYHAVSKFNVVTGNSIKSSSNIPTYTEFLQIHCVISQKIMKK